MEISSKKADGKTVVEVKGYLDTVSAEEFQNFVNAMPVEDTQHVVVDCMGLEYISSSGLRVFITLLKKAQKNGGKVEVTNLNSTVREIFDMTDFSSLFGLK